MKRLYRWKSSLQGERPDGVKLGTCYEIERTADTRGIKAFEYDLIDTDGSIVAGGIPIKFLEECVPTTIARGPNARKRK